jgi:hypothetical protein
MEKHDQRSRGDGIDRHGMLKCMACVGTGVLWTLRGGVPPSRAFGQDAAGAAAGDFSFVQISDSHIGFAREPNRDVTATLTKAVRRINTLPGPPAFVLHTGDLTHLARPGEFDTLAEVLKGVRTQKLFTVPGEHDFDAEGNKLYLERFGRGSRGAGWYSFDYKGVHFVGLVNVANAKSGSPAGLAAVAAAALSERDARRGARTWYARALLSVAALLVALTGHFGGLMAHGRDFFDW